MTIVLEVPDNLQVGVAQIGRLDQIGIYLFQTMIKE
jgi:hypothetical protein